MNDCTDRAENQGKRLDGRFRTILQMISKNRKAVPREMDLERTAVKQIIKNSFLHLYEKDLEKAYPIFKKKRISLLPVIDHSNKLIDFITIDDIYEYLENR